MPTYEDRLRPLTGEMRRSIGVHAAYLDWLDFGIDDLHKGDVIKVDGELIHFDHYAHVRRGFGGSLPARHEKGAATEIISAGVL